MKRASRHYTFPRGMSGNKWTGPAKGQTPMVHKVGGAGSFKCPTCDVEPGNPCVSLGLRPPSKKGDVMTSYHPSRKRLAIRADNEERERAGVLAPGAAVTRKPRPLEDPDGGQCPVCGLSIRLTATGRLASHTVKATRPNRRGLSACAGSGTLVVK